jgi:hypothetical protein
VADPNDGEVEGGAVDAKPLGAHAAFTARGDVDGAWRSVTEAVEPEEESGSVVGQRAALAASSVAPNANWPHVTGVPASRYTWLNTRIQSPLSTRQQIADREKPHRVACSREKTPNWRCAR